MRYALTALCLVLSGCAAGSAGDDEGGSIGLSSIGTGQCFEGSAVTNFNVRSSGTVYVSTRQGYVFRLDGPAGCFDAGTQTIAVDSIGPRVCVGTQANVHIGRTDSQPLTCRATVSGPITDSTLSGLPGRS